MASVCILFSHHRIRIAALPKNLRSVHFVFILIFAEIGAAGVRAAIDLLFGTAEFFATFRQPNLLSLPSNAMCWIASMYALAGPVYFVAVMALGQMNARGRKAYLLLVVPFTALYPLIMGNLTGISQAQRCSNVGVTGVFMAFTALGAIGLLFYRLRFVSNAFLPPKS